MNVELLEQKEKLFAEYRNKITELEATRKQAEDFGKVFQACQTQIDRLERETGSMRKLIEYMIRNDLDPVSAKLKYDEECESKLNPKTFHHPVYSIGSASSTITASTGGFVATTIDDLLKDNNTYDKFWLDH